MAFLTLWATWIQLFLIMNSINMAFFLPYLWVPFHLSKSVSFSSPQPPLPQTYLPWSLKTPKISLYSQFPGIPLSSYTSGLSSSQYTVPRFLMFFVPLWPALHISNRLFYIPCSFVSHFMSQIVLCMLFTDKILFLPPFHLFTLASKNFQT